MVVFNNLMSHSVKVEGNSLILEATIRLILSHPKASRWVGGAGNCEAIL